MNIRNEKRNAKRRTLGLLSAAIAGALALTLPGISAAQSKATLRIGYQKYGTLTLLTRTPPIAATGASGPSRVPITEAAAAQAETSTTAVRGAPRLPSAKRSNSAWHVWKHSPS